MCHPFSMVCTCIVLTLAVVALAGTMLILFYYAQGYIPNAQRNDITYGPGDTQTLFFSPIFCDGLTPDPNTMYPANKFDASTLYLLSEQPTLSEKTNIVFQDTITDKKGERNFHFYSDTVISFKACIDNITNATFYLIQGNSNYKEWDKRSPSSSVLRAVSLETPCNQGEHTFSFTVTEEDQYYFVFTNSEHVTSAVSVHYDIQRSVYAVDQRTVKTSCNFTSTPCSLSMPLMPTAPVLLVYGSPVDWGSDWENKVININCSIRIWIYVVLCIGGILVILACTMCICACCYCCRRWGDGDISTAPLLSRRTGTLYEKPGAEEMDDPSRDFQHNVNHSDPYITFRSSSKKNDSHLSPSYKKSLGDKFSLGSPTFETFAGNHN